MASPKKKPRKSSPKKAPKKAFKRKPSASQTAADKKAKAIAKLVEAAKKAQAKNAGLIADLREDPGMADKLREMMEDDLRRVYAAPREVFGPSASRDRYRQIGHYSTSLVPLLYGMWAEFQRGAGIKPTLATNTVLRNISKTARAQAVARYAEEAVRPWDGAYNKLYIGKKSFKMMVISDLHSRYCNPFALRVAHDINVMEAPAAIRVNGDLVDFPQLSTHRQLPGHFPMSVKDEINWATGKVLGPLRFKNPKADIKFVLGNHDIRMVYAMADKCPLFADINELTYAEQFKLDQLEIGLVCRANFLAPTARKRKVDQAENWETLFNAEGRPFWTTVHGFLCGADAPDKHMRKFMTNGTNGHLHNAKHVTGGSYSTGVLDWFQTSTMAHPQAIAAGYVPGPVDALGWTCGGLVVTLDPVTCTAHGETFRVFEEHAVYRDRVWKIRQSERDQIQEMLEV